MTLGPLILPDNPGSNAYLAKLKDTIIPLPFADPGPYGDQCGNTMGLQAIPSSGVGEWSQVSGPGLATFSPSVNDPTVSLDVDQFGSYTFAWTETNVNGSDDSIFTVEFFEPPVVVVGLGGDVCGLTHTLNAVLSSGTGNWTLQTGPGTALFSPSSSTPNASVTVSETGSYEFLWTETNGPCSQSSVVIINFLDKLYR